MNVWLVFGLHAVIKILDLTERTLNSVHFEFCPGKITLPKKVSALEQNSAENLYQNLSGCQREFSGIGVVFEGGLSGGERKRATIACELIRDAQLLLIDVSF